MAGTPRLRLGHWVVWAVGSGHVETRPHPNQEFRDRSWCRTVADRHLTRRQTGAGPAQVCRPGIHTVATRPASLLECSRFCRVSKKSRQSGAQDHPQTYQELPVLDFQTTNLPRVPDDANCCESLGQRCRPDGFAVPPGALALLPQGSDRRLSGHCTQAEMQATRADCQSRDAGTGRAARRLQRPAYTGGTP